MAKKKYKVKTIETLVKTVIIEAESKEDALRSAVEAYNREMILPDDKDFDGVRFNARYISPQESERLLKESDVFELKQAEIWG